MTAVSFARVPTIAAIVVVAMLATTTLTLAASSNGPVPVETAHTEVEQPFLVVPDVRRQAYVFAKGSLEQAGFAWRVSGPVRGFAANMVSSQAPAPGTRVVADGAPIINLQLSRNSSYEQQGLPENASPYKGRPVKLLVTKRKVRAALPPATTPAPTAAPVAKPATKPKRATKPALRKPAFAVSGAPVEPSDEMTLTARAKQLDAWLKTHETRSPRNVNHWLYQHNWIVTGAGFGWSGGAEALRVLIQVDERAQKLWGVGGKSEQVARRTLAEVKARLR